MYKKVKKKNYFSYKPVKIDIEVCPFHFMRSPYFLEKFMNTQQIVTPNANKGISKITFVNMFDLMHMLLWCNKIYEIPNVLNMKIIEEHMQILVVLPNRQILFGTLDDMCKEQPVQRYMWILYSYMFYD